MTTELPGRLAAYIRALPGGLDSHLEFRAKGSVVTAMLENESDAVREQLRGLPEPLARLVESPPVATAWIPEVLMVGLFLGAADFANLSNADIAATAKSVNMRLFGRPMYKVLGALMRPERAVGYLASVWERFHQGTRIEWRRTDVHEMHGTVYFPEHLYPREMLLAFSTSFEAVSELGPPEATCEVGDVSATQGEFILRWR